MKFKDIPKFKDIEPFNSDKPSQRGAELLDNENFPNSMGTSIARIVGQKECTVCKELTDFYDELFLDHICSEECEEKWWEEYNEAIRLSPVLWEEFAQKEESKVQRELDSLLAPFLNYESKTQKVYISTKLGEYNHCDFIETLTKFILKKLSKETK